MISPNENKGEHIELLASDEDGHPQPPSRRDFLVDMGRFGVAALAVLNGLLTADSAEAKTFSYKAIPPPNLGYKQVVKETAFGKIELADRASALGRAQRVLRFKNIAEAVGRRFGVPSHHLLGMIMQESYGDPVQPNESGDGGLGLIHMQPVMARAYGLDLITDSRRLRDFAQGRKIEAAIDFQNGDLKDLVSLDDRFHPVKNIDAAARMLCDLYNREGWWGALKRYAGRRSYPARVIRYGHLLKSGKFQQQMRKDFERRNPGRKFDAYIAAFRDMNRNYGLDKYRKLPVVGSPEQRRRKR